MRKPKVKKATEPKFNLKDPVEFIQCVQYYAPRMIHAQNKMCKGDYYEALKEFEPLEKLMPCEDYKSRILQCIEHCRKMSLGILDLRRYGCGVYLDGQPITPEQMEEVLSKGRAATIQFGSRKRNKRISIGGMVMNLFDEHGLDLEYGFVLDKVKEVAPDSKFNPHHLAYYKSKYKADHKG